MQLSRVNTEYSIHRVQHTPSTAYTEDCIHWVLHLSTIHRLPIPASFASLGKPYWTQISKFPWLPGKKWIESQLLSHLPPDLPPADRPPPCTASISIDQGLQVHLQSRSITTSKFISKLAQSRPPSASPNWLYHQLQVDLCVTQSRCPSASPMSLEHGLQCISEFNLISACKCISELLDLGL